MGSTTKTASLAAERAVRLLRKRHAPVGSVELARAVLRTMVRDEEVARRILETAFAGDDRLAFEDGGWRVRSARARQAGDPATTSPPPVPEPDCVLLIVRGGIPSRGAGYALRDVAAVR